MNLVLLARKPHAPLGVGYKGLIGALAALDRKRTDIINSTKLCYTYTCSTLTIKHKAFWTVSVVQVKCLASSGVLNERKRLFFKPVQAVQNNRPHLKTNYIGMTTYQCKTVEAHQL